MDYKTLLDWHCSGNYLDIKDIKHLENELQISLKSINQDILLDRAPAHICKSCLISENSLWISCLASALDQLVPLPIGNSRTQELFNLLCKHGVVIMD